MNLQQHIEHFIKHYYKPAARVVVALSGGVDSVVLLDLLARSSLNLSQLKVVHVHHGLNRDADAWVEFCRELCLSYQVEFSVERVELSRHGRGIEAAARDARYQALAKHIAEHDILVTAQHAGDQAETLLLALKRGSGALGMAAMPIAQSFGAGHHNRPLLGVTRADIAAYAGVQQLAWIEDDSNQDSRFDRNYLRNEILPLLNQRWPGFSHSVARSAGLLGQSIELLDELAAIDYAKALFINKDIVNKDIVNQTLFTKQVVAEDLMAAQALAIDVVSELSTARQNNLIRYWLRRHQLAMPSQAQLQQIIEQILGGVIDSDPVVSLSGTISGSPHYSGYQVRRYRGAMMIVRPQRDISLEVMSWQGQNCISLPDQLGTLEFKLNGTGNDDGRPLYLVAPGQQRVEIRFSVAGSYKAWPVGRDKRRRVKKLWQEFAVPTWLRSRTPLVFFDDKLVAALGIWVERGYQASAIDSSLVIIWHRARGSGSNLALNTNLPRYNHFYPDV